MHHQNFEISLTHRLNLNITNFSKSEIAKFYVNNVRALLDTFSLSSIFVTLSQATNRNFISSNQGSLTEVELGTHGNQTVINQV